MIEIAKVRVTGANVRCNGSKIPRGMAGAYISVQYDSVWDNLVKTVVFKGSSTIDVVTNKNIIEVPHEVLQSVGKRVYIGFYGTAATGKVIIPTFWAELGTVVESTDPSGDESTDPALPVYAALTEQVGDLEEEQVNIKTAAESAMKAATEADKKAGNAKEQADNAIRNINALREVVSKFHSNIVEKASGETIILDDASDMELAGLNVYGRTTQNGTPTPDAPVPLDSVGSDGSVTVKVGTSETNGNPQSMTISTPNGLPGIPVTSGGNYTDGSGQQWICDEVDFEKGVYVQRVEKRVFTGTEAFRVHASGRYYLDIANGRFDITDTWGLFSNDVSREGGTQFGSGGVYFKTAHSTVDEFKAYLADNYASGQPITAQVVLRTFIETALSAEQLSAFAALHTNYPNTTVFNDKNAGMEVKYVADTKLYIDKKFDQLAAAMLNN